MVRCLAGMDTLGVSCDGAMPSGLVPVTNAVTAISELVDDSCGILAPGEDPDAMARGISLLYEQPLKLSVMPKAAANRFGHRVMLSGPLMLSLSLY